MTRTLWTGWGATLLAALLLTGCTEESTPGGPGATTTPAETGADADTGIDNDTGGAFTNEPEPGEPQNPDMTFTLGMPTGATNVEQGQSEVVTISIDRGDQFTEEVTVQLTPPQGITVEPQQFTFASGQEESDVQVTAGPTATIGEHNIQVQGQSASGPPAKGTLTIEVTKADDAGGDQPDLDPAAPANPAQPNPANPEEGAPAPAVQEENP
jgi:hypothetical protein